MFTQPEKYPVTSEVLPESQRDDWVPVYRPFIPEYHFDGGVSRDAWDILVVPSSADQPEDLRFYRGPENEQIPITTLLDGESEFTRTQAESVNEETLDSTDEDISMKVNSENLNWMKEASGIDADTVDDER